MGDTNASILSQMEAAGLEFYATDGKIFRATDGKKRIVIEDYEGPSLEEEDAEE